MDCDPRGAAWPSRRWSTGSSSCRERFGVTYYNDSKGTNPDAAIQAIQAMPGPTLLIAGGYDKHSEYDEWIESFDGKVQVSGAYRPDQG